MPPSVASTSLGTGSISLAYPATLAARRRRWEVSLRSHLDIMNENFARVSDGSHAWAARKTYIREIEELNLNTLDVLLGSALVVDNPSANHYFGSIRRLGQALSESRDSTEFEERIAAMMHDPEIDEYNRTRLTFLYAGYLYNHPTEARQRTAAFKKQARTLPAFLAAAVEALQDPD